MVFDDLEVLDTFDVDILEDPYDIIEKNGYTFTFYHTPKNRQLCLRLFNEKSNGERFVPEKSGLNQWNAGGRARDPNELYIPFNKKDRERKENIDFFPPRYETFKLYLPDGKELKATICQSDGKAIMSNPNKDLGKWLLRDVLNLKKGQIISYELLQQKGFDAVLFEKLGEKEYKINFTNSMTYNRMYNIAIKTEE